MKGGTHAAIGLAAGLLVARVAHIEGVERFTLALITAGAALLPDLDHPQAALRQRAGFAGDLLFRWFKHRGILHSLIIPAVMFAAITVMRADQRLAVIPIGYASHLLGDFVTVQGTPLLAPISWKRLRLPIVRTGSLLETLILFGVIAGVVWMVQVHQ